MIFEKEEKEAIEKVLKRNWWALDLEGKAFEEELVQVVQKKFAIFTNSGSSVFILTFEGLNLLEKKRKKIRLSFLLPYSQLQLPLFSKQDLSLL